MKYLMTFHMDADNLPGRELSDKCFAEMMAFVSELKADGTLLFDSQVLSDPAPYRVSDGAENPVQPDVLGGFFLIEVADRQAAVRLVNRCPHRQVGAISLYTLNETDTNAYR